MKIKYMIDKIPESSLSLMSGDLAVVAEAHWPLERGAIVYLDMFGPACCWVSTLTRSARTFYFDIRRLAYMPDADFKYVLTKRISKIEVGRIDMALQWLDGHRRGQWEILGYDRTSMMFSNGTLGYRVPRVLLNYCRKKELIFTERRQIT